MCYHLSLKADSERLKERYRANQLKKLEKLEPVYHTIAFSYMPWPVITSAEPDTIQLMEWGLIPSWTKNHEDAIKLRKNTPNARIETVFEKASFRQAAHKKHCLVPATGFFEWQTIKGKKYPHYIYLKDQEIFSLAGIWETWTDKESGETKETFSILTTEANPLMATIHNSKERMPVILAKETELDWLHKGFDETTIDSFATPFDENEMAAYTISRKISERDSNTPEVLKPYTYPEFTQTSLF
ncbi:SOS response-associated peptidase [Emticicia sp. BO119]|uniref:SOS response-associated peptidase n=1 Tax=Emticicia sp. BO119 TaxID=2757768 RepID=UPI0015F0D0A6|nr:SOS response-associated peptidase [Emticicia sp. BO119]MBA4853938.1 SOS response-associated peptidase [Emticicia sp. BO119]